MCDSTLAIYCFIDDLLKARGHHEDCRAEITDAEVITIALTAMLSFGGNFERARLVLHELGLIRQLLSRSRFSRRVNRLSDLIHCLFHQLGAVLKDLHSRIAVSAGFFSDAGLRQHSLKVAAWSTTSAIAEKSRANAASFTA